MSSFKPPSPEIPSGSRPARWPALPIIVALACLTAFAAQGAQLQLTTGQTLDVADFSRSGDSVRLETTAGAVLSLPLERFVPPVEGWLKSAAQAEKEGRYREAAQLVALAGKWDPAQRDEAREAALIARIADKANADFLATLEKGDYEAARSAYQDVLDHNEGKAPEACRAALNSILEKAKAAEDQGDYDAAEKAYRNYLTVLPDAAEPKAAIEALGPKRSKAAYEKQVAGALEMARSGDATAARMKLKELLSNHPDDRRLTDALDALDREVEEAKVRRQLDAVRGLFEKGEYDTFLLACGVLEKAGADTSEFDAFKKQIAKVRIDFAKTLQEKLKKTPHIPLKVTCQAAPDEPYYLYLPPEYDGAKPFPILYLHAPGGGNDRSVWQLMEKIVKPRKWIIAQPINSQNGPWGTIWRSQSATLEDTTRHLNLDPRLRFAAGFSGGGRASLSLAFRHPTKVRGVMPMGAGWPINTDLVPKSPMAVCIVCGRSDSNIKHDIPDTFRKLKGYGLPVTTMLFQGGHTLPPKDTAEEAFQWLLKNAP